MERRARCRLCKKLITYNDPSSLGQHLLTCHPDSNPVFFSNSAGSANTTNTCQHTKLSPDTCDASLSEYPADTSPCADYECDDEDDDDSFVSLDNDLPCSPDDEVEHPITKSIAKEINECKKKIKKQLSACDILHQGKRNNPGILRCRKNKDHKKRSQENICINAIKKLPEHKDSLILAKEACRKKSKHDEKSKCKCNYYKTTVTSWRPGKKHVSCPFCGEEVIPMIRKQRHKLTRHSLFATCLLGCWPLCFIFPIKFKQHSQLYCPLCLKSIGEYDRKNGRAKFTSLPRNKTTNTCQA